MTTDDHLARASDAIVDHLTEHHSCTQSELESRMAERYHFGDTRNIDPHHFTTALRSLTSDGTVGSQRKHTRGTNIDPIETFHLTGSRTRTKIDRAAARKRLLSARYKGWAQGSKRHPHGLIGPAGEAAVRGGLRDTMQPMAPAFGEVHTLLGFKLRGSIDTGGYLVTVDGNGRPMTTLTVPVEVKNLRSWLYPTAQEVYQLLSKCADAQRLVGTDAVLLPTLVCRRAHPTLFWMAGALGFVVIDARRQWVGNVEDQALLEVRNELHFIDLHAGSDPSIRVHDRFSKSRLLEKAPDLAAAWAATADDAPSVDLIHRMRSEKSAAQRHQIMAALRRRSSVRGVRGGW
ncbi:hypothetical protein IGS73_14865 [Janibacter indicus]|uniref:Uncharacterized protein n=1 Tax=Janibacter indicus TaxID=857417 RepID=A0A7L9J115_9MICO|nr:hypothetical protein [Janibacter indicus]QOK22350.1 hypothetical protein IGS73_14865 [Janibacter indicus]